MRVVLAYPPDFTPPSIPFGSLAVLNACLKREGHVTKVCDLNAWAFEVQVRAANLDRYLAVLEERVDGWERRSDLTSTEATQLRSFRRLRAFPRERILRVRDAVRTLRDPASFYDPERFLPAHRTVLATHGFLNAFTPRLDSRNAGFNEELYRKLNDPTPDGYVDSYLAVILPEIVAFRPDLVALTCPFAPQVATGMAFAKLLRAQLPDVKFVMGGTGLADAKETVLVDPRFYDVVDYGCVSDGEEALPLLAAALEGRSAFDAVPGLWRRVDGVVRRPKTTRNADLDRTPTPDYLDLDFSLYMLPEKAAVYTTSRGCYYNKCTFCPESFRIDFRMRSPERVYEDVRDLVLRQGVRHVHFFDPLTPPRTLAHVARETARENLPLAWHAEVKFEAIYTSRAYVRRLAEGGCKLLQFGLESAVQRVLDGMKKGNRVAQVEEILDNLRDHGVPASVTWFIGFPTENEADARETWRFIRRRADDVHLSLYTGTFGLGPDVPVFRDPAHYGIEISRDAAGDYVYRRDDRGDWDQQPLHRAFHVRSDIPILIGGAALLYAAKDPELLKRIRGAESVGPTSWEDPPLAERRLARAEGLGSTPLPPGPGGARRALVYVAASGEQAELEDADLVLLDLAGDDGRTGAELLSDPRAPRDAARRLADLVDRGFLETKSPVGATV
ncbi:MAG TPA: radical SAM protein [Planctomycetota bacterium]|nr:radical SAM protein [Planctomycetota bacterium]